MVLLVSQECFWSLSVTYNPEGTGQHRACPVIAGGSSLLCVEQPGVKFINCLHKSELSSPNLVPLLYEKKKKKKKVIYAVKSFT